MSKSETIWIPDNYYQGFLRGCLANELIEETPSKTALENAGCEISALCYLITPDGKQHNPRIMKPNDLSTSIRKLFSAKVSDEPEQTDSTPKTLPEEVGDMIMSATSQRCDTCNESKPIEAFKKFPGRGIKRKSTCIECEAKAKAETTNASHMNGSEFKRKLKDTLLGSNESASTPDQEPKAEIIVTDAEIIEKHPTVCVTLAYLKRLATDAYERGREYERSNVETVEPSLDELLGIGA
ncbi:hypothetical protein [Sulfuricurvum sp.]|uniref:hypothetical protein n=1 Tax=Sulfuricurvum sp. TaxID=2025608 RepID=UPI002610E5D5|nr:hypothetical protein [Sulfuricurvum sp.]MDD2267037.1 hypothetical protein [Sulfuricurvum sp.]MDD2785070.1 hypothetical protein [Sulfuricurvum sp.]